MQHSQFQILVNQLSYGNDKPLFQSLSLAFGNEKTGLIGRNGVGKSTLLKLLMGEITAESGSIQITGTVAYCPQQMNIPASTTVADLLEIQNELGTIRRYLNVFGLKHIDLYQSAADLSGGERTRLLLAKVFSSNADFLVLDEPTNNLDITARELLYDAVSRWNKGLLIVSHDRTLLNLMDRTIELTSLGADIYGGNYDHYEEQKLLRRDATQRELSDAKKALNKTRTSAQATRERGEQKRSQGRKLFLTGKIDKLFARAQQGRSERTHGRSTRQAENQINDAQQKVTAARAKIEVHEDIIVDLPATHVPNGKIIVDLEHVYFSPKNKCTIINNFSLCMTGPERIALIGANGSGKTTLVKLILGELTATTGKIFIGTEHISYLDQQAKTLNPELSIAANFLRLNPEAKPIDAHAALAKFLFRNTAAHKLVKNLSGGEKLRAELACALMAKHPPQLLILDEPTNHLDLASIAGIESALKNYQGAMIVISHDMRFLENIDVSKFVRAPFIG